MGIIEFRLKEAQSFYKVSSGDLCKELDVHKSTLSEWRTRKKNPGLNRIEDLFNAIERLGDSERLREKPLTESSLIKWIT